MRLAAVLCLVLLSEVMAINPPPPYFDNAAQDKYGVVWAFSRAECNQIYRYDGKEWSVVNGGFASDQSAMPAHVVRMTDGSVACIWRVLKDRAANVAVTAHSGKAARLLGICPGEIDGSGLKLRPFADSQNQLWITNQSPEIFRAGSDGVVKVYEMAAEDYVGGKKQRAGFNDVHAVEDGHGRIWVWSDPHASNYASLRGVLIFTGNQHVLRDSFETIKGNQILAIAKADDQHMWVAVGNDGLYRVDIDSFAAEREPDPAPKALRCVHELHVNGEELYAVEALPNFKNTLWRKKNGQWTQLMPNFDAHTSSFVPRSWLPVKEGMLVESYQAGPWFISPEGEATQLSWKTGFRMENVRALTRLDDGSFFCLGSNSQIYHGPLTLPPQEINEAPRVVQLETNRKWALDPSKQLWILSTDKPPLLKQWDGHQWISHAIPESTERSNFERVKADDRGRIWPMPQSDSQPQAVYDFDTGKWLSFSSLPEAFLALNKTPPQFLDDEWFLTPQYSKDLMRIAYRRGVVFVCYYDGFTWQEWKRSDITGKTESDNAVGPPWFDSKGNLRVNIRNKTSWIRSADGKWSELPYERMALT